MKWMHALPFADKYKENSTFGAHRICSQFQQQRVDRIAEGLPKRAWKRLSAGAAQHRRTARVCLLPHLCAPTQGPPGNSVPSGRASLGDRDRLRGCQGRVWTGPLRSPPLATLIPTHDPGHAGPCGAGHPTRPQRKNSTRRSAAQRARTAPPAGTPAMARKAPR